MEDSSTDQVPPTLEGIVEIILSDLRAQETLQGNLFFGLIIAILLENGFVPYDQENENNLMQLILFSKKATGLYEAHFSLSQFNEIDLKVVATTLGSTMLVNAVIVNLNMDTYSICLAMGRYVVSPQASRIPLIFRDLRHFSMLFKSRIIAPVRSIILTHFGYPSASLIGLPEEVLMKIAVYLPINDILNLTRTCRSLCSFTQNERLWRILCFRDFNIESNDDDIDFKNLYKQEHITNQDNILKAAKLEATGVQNIHDFMEYADYYSNIENPLWRAVVL